MNLLFLDTETGGLNPSLHSLLQVGVVAYVDGKIRDSIKFNLCLDEYNVTETAMKINGLDLEELQRNGDKPEVVVARLNEFIKTNFGEQLPILVGHNPSIDKYMVRYQIYEANGLDMDKFISHRMIDTMSCIWMLHFAGKLPLNACSSSGAFNHFSIHVDRLHDALEDCVATVRLFEELQKLMK